MGFRFSRRRAIVAGVAATVALGSAAAYAVSLPELPVKLPQVQLDIPVNLPQPVIPPPDIQLPQPIVGPPDGDELPDLGDVLGSAEAGARAARPAATSEHRASLVKPDVRLPDWKDWRPGDKLPDWKDWRPGDKLPDWKDWRPGDKLPDWSRWGPGKGGVVHIGDGINIGRNDNNVRIVVDTEPGNDTTIEQRSEGGDVVTCVVAGEASECDE